MLPSRAIDCLEMADAKLDLELLTRELHDDALSVHAPVSYTHLTLPTNREV